MKYDHEAEEESRRIWDEAKKLCDEIDAKAKSSGRRREGSLGTCKRLSQSPTGAEALNACKKGVYTPDKPEDLNSYKKGVHAAQKDGELSGEEDDLGSGVDGETPLFLRYGCGTRLLAGEAGDDGEEVEAEPGWEDEACLKEFFTAVKDGELDTVRMLLERWDFEGDETDIAGDRVLHIAAR